MGKHHSIECFWANPCWAIGKYYFWGRGMLKSRNRAVAGSSGALAQVHETTHRINQLG